MASVSLETSSPSQVAHRTSPPASEPTEPRSPSIAAGLRVDTTSASFAILVSFFRQPPVARQFLSQPLSSDRLFPLNRPWRLRSNVVDDAVDSPNLTDNSARDLPQHFIGKRSPVRRHSIFTLHSPNRAGIGVRPLIAHHTNALDRQKNSEALPHLAIQSLRLDLRNDNLVGLLQQRYSICGHLAKNPNRQSRPWKGLPLQNLIRHPQITANAPHLILEKIAQRLDQLQLHILGQAANIVVTLDSVRRTMNTARLDNIGIERSLHQPTNLITRTLLGFDNPRSLIIEHRDELI